MHLSRHFQSQCESAASNYSRYSEYTWLNYASRLTEDNYIDTALTYHENNRRVFLQRAQTAQKGHYHNNSGHNNQNVDPDVEVAGIENGQPFVDSGLEPQP